MSTTSKRRSPRYAVPAERQNAQPPAFYTIGSAAAASGVSAKMIRHYEAMGLFARPERTAGNYRVYGETQLHMLRFINRARSLGFSMKQIAELLSLWQNRSRQSETVRRLALEHVEVLERKASELQGIARTLKALARACHGDARPECPILDDLALPAAASGDRS